MPVLAPARHRVPGATVAVAGERPRVGGVEVAVAGVGPDRLHVERVPAPPGAPPGDGAVVAAEGEGWSGEAG
ncbi:MAG: hypothetical protein D6683_14970 [Actinomyces sp.]|nr:MAG: hypothetical protein D6683_14970 [Actinomyces sp.]